MGRRRFDRLYELVGDRVCRTRRALGLSQETLAKRVSVNRVSIVNIEKGNQRCPLDLLWAIAEVLQVEVVQLIPRSSDLVRADAGVQLEADDLRAIRDATRGDVAAARQISDFVRRAKARAAETKEFRDDN